MKNSIDFLLEDSLRFFCWRFVVRFRDNVNRAPRFENPAHLPGMNECFEINKIPLELETSESSTPEILINIYISRQACKN